MSITATEGELRRLAARRRRVERAAERVRADTRAAILAGAAEGLSAYRMAQLLDLSEAYVGRVRRAATTTTTTEGNA